MRLPKEKQIRWIGIPILGFLLTFIVKDDHHESLGYLLSTLITIAFTAVFWNGAVLIIFKLRRVYPSISSTGKRLLISIVLLSLFLIVSANGLRILFGVSSWEDLLTWSKLTQYSEVNFIASFMMASFYEASFFFSKWKEAIVTNEELKNQQVRTQFEVLQNQMSPHFLFNSLNTLTTLIAEDQQVAIKFTQTLSEVYRYILQNKEKELVQLKEEIEFSCAYLSLLQMRYPENLSLQLDIKEEYQNRYIAPLTIQMLIENAVKHNVISKTHPLCIHISIEGKDRVLVKNLLQPKNTLEKSTKTGLENIRKRYAYFDQGEVKIESDKYFSVSVPMIDVVLK